jgi:predicted RNA-binding Zn ribbon-like protein
MVKALGGGARESMVTKEREAGSLELVGGRACLDFANTVNKRNAPFAHDYLRCYRDLVTWSVHAGLLTREEAAGLMDEAERLPVKAARVFRLAIKIRKTVYRIFSGVAQGQRPTAADIDSLNRFLSRVVGRQKVFFCGKGFQWGWFREEGTLDFMLWPILRSAGDLLTSKEIKKVRQCARREACDWLFLDTSKNGSRRWCSMSTCGNLEKAKKYYRRKMKARRPET